MTPVLRLPNDGKQATNTDNGLLTKIAPAPYLAEKAAKWSENDTEVKEYVLGLIFVYVLSPEEMHYVVR